ncbi:hypothetical protein ES705_26550 [subsurface metagenome]
MAKLLNKEQFIRTGVKYPVSGYSRVTGFWTGALPVIGDEGQESTHACGQSVWLLSVQLSFWANVIGEQCSGWWFLSTSTKRPETAGEVLNVWSPIIPCSSGVKPYYRWDGDMMDFSWTMNRYYEGAGRRFGLWFQNLSAKRWWVQATFEISEG